MKDYARMSKVELVKELEALYQPKGKKIMLSDNCCPFFRGMMNNKQECFMALFLDGANQVIGQEVLFVGTANCSLVHPRALFRSAVKHNAVNIIIGHNHPSGNTEPSAEDIKITERLSKAGGIIGIPIIDHIIVTETSHYSFHGNGRLEIRNYKYD